MATTPEVSTALVPFNPDIRKANPIQPLIETLKHLALDRFASLHLVAPPPDITPEKALRARTRRLADVLPPFRQTYSNLSIDRY